MRSYGSRDSRRWGDINVGESMDMGIGSAMGLGAADIVSSCALPVLLGVLLLLLGPLLVCAQQNPDRWAHLGHP